MLSVDEARDRILSHICPLEPTKLDLLEALGLVLAKAVIADVNLPPFRNSAMDGYAVRWEDLRGASGSTPVRLDVRGESVAGHPAEMRVEPETAVRIMTGAPVPEGATAVVRFEDVRLIDRHRESEDPNSEPMSIELITPCVEWQNVRQAGEDVSSGSRVLERGIVLGPAQLGLLAALNHEQVTVIRRPVVAVLSTGDEVVPIGPELRPGQVRDSNSVLIAAMIRRAGASPRLLGIARDSEHDIKCKICEGQTADLIVTCGGVSVGDFDLVKNVLQREGAIELWQVGIKPGKPMAYGFIGETPLLGLPGNPVAAAVTFSQFGIPIIRRMLGMPYVVTSNMKARLGTELWNLGGRRNFVRAVARREGEELLVSPVPGQGSGSLAGLARANCFIVCAEDIEYVPAGSTVEIEMIDHE
ncbi:MAG: gephyrin-like molybdotransferase Glp [Nitrolancea sp.]